MKNIFETESPKENRLEDPEFFEKVKGAVAERFDDLATDPRLDGVEIPLDLGEKVRRGEKVPLSRLVRDALIGVGDDFRLTRDEIDELEEKFLDRE